MPTALPHHQSVRKYAFFKKENSREVQRKLTLTTNRRVVVKGVGGRDGLGAWDKQVQTIVYRMDKRQGPTV